MAATVSATALLVRERALVVNLESVKAIITADQASSLAGYALPDKPRPFV